MTIASSRRLCSPHDQRSEASAAHPLYPAPAAPFFRPGDVHISIYSAAFYTSCTVVSVMRLDKDSFFFHRLWQRRPANFQSKCPLPYDPCSSPRPFSVSLHSPVKFHLLHLLIYCPVSTEPATDFHLSLFMRSTNTILKVSCHSCFPQSRSFQHFQQRGLSRIV